MAKEATQPPAEAGAVDTSDKALNIATKLMMASDQLMSAFEQLLNLKEQTERGGVSFTDPAVEAAIAASSLKHVSGDNFNSVISSSVTVKTFMDQNFHTDNFQKVRP